MKANNIIIEEMGLLRQKSGDRQLTIVVKCREETPGVRKLLGVWTSDV